VIAKDRRDPNTDQMCAQSPVTFARHVGCVSRAPMSRLWLLALLVTSCTQSVDVIEPDNPADVDPPDPTKMPPTSEAALSNAEQTAFNYFVSKGLTDIQSAGVVGNLIQESNVIASAVEFGGGPGRGIAQWSVGGRWNASHHDNVTWYASLNKETRWALHTQLAFTWYELHTVGGYGITALRKATTIRGATLDFERDFEKCGQCDESKRISYATQVYNAFASSAREVGADDEDPNDSGLDAEADESAVE
jgi:Phage tail lysozyme